MAANDSREEARAPHGRLQRAEAYLEGLINLERAPSYAGARMSLAPVEALLAKLGNPERGLRVLHIAGSKGKGSTALLSEALLLSAGLRVGTFTSPHLERWTERFRIAGREIDGDRLADAVERLRPAVDALRAGPDPPSFFDATTAAALLVFAEEKVDVAILEVGLGGRLDSTNAVTPAVTCITTIELEHTDKLGSTLAAIAGEKAGIAKRGVPLVTGALAPAAAAVAAERASALDAPLARLGAEFSVSMLAESLGGTRARFTEGDFTCELTLAALGRHQAANAALALACARRLRVLSDDELARAARHAFARAQLPGRIEVVSRAPWIVIDGAHTEESASALARVLAQIPRRSAHLVISISAGKALAAICAALVPHADRVTVTRAEPIRSLTPAEVAGALRAAAPGLELRIVPNPHLALRAARESLGADELLVATGSFYLAGIARSVLRS
ncbi:MAG TPA: Mur ligase family protein [Myxococcota bacterium]|jgi:dihydrofolate synthase/folylpolyglutamate synthase